MTKLFLFQNVALLCYFSWFIQDIYSAEKLEKITYVSVEHPVILYHHPQYIPYASLTAKRYGRSSPVYYVGLTLNITMQFDNKIMIDFFFYEFLTNQYKRSFVEMHWRWCDLIHKDKFFGAAMKQGKLDRPCPYPPDVYEMSNMTINPDIIPKGFPFTKGRIYANITNTVNNMFLGGGYIDMEMRTLKVKKRVKNEKL